MKLLTKVLQRFLWEDVVKILMKFCQRCLHQLEHVLMRRSCEDPADSLEESLRGLAQVLMRRSCWDPGEVPIRGPSMILHRPLSEGLVEMVRSFPRGPWNKILQMPYLRGACMDSPRDPGMKTLVQASYSSLWEDLEEVWWNSLGVLAWSRTGPCEKIVWRSCWNPSHVKRSLH